MLPRPDAADMFDSRLKAALQAQARGYLRLARGARRNFAGTRHRLRQHAPLILGTVMAAQDSQRRLVLDEVLNGYADSSWKEMVAAIRRIVAGERDEEALQQGQLGSGSSSTPSSPACATRRRSRTCSRPSRRNRSNLTRVLAGLLSGIGSTDGLVFLAASPYLQYMVS